MTGETSVVVYVQPYCQPCHEVERFLAERGVSFTSRDVSRDAAALNDLAEHGFMGTPVTCIGDTWIAGFNRRQIAHALEAIGCGA